MKKIILLALTFTLLGHADNEVTAPTPSTGIPAIDATQPPVKAQNVYAGKVLLDVVTDYHNREGRNGDDYADDKKMFIVGNTALAFSLNRCRNDDPEFRMIDRESTADVTMSVVDLSPDLSKFKIDITVQNFLLKNALTRAHADKLTSRYEAEVISCDGEAPVYGTDSKDIRKIIGSIAGQSFAQSMGCLLRLKLVNNEPDFVSDPWFFIKDHSTPTGRGEFYRDRRRYRPDAGTEIVGLFNLVVGPSGSATLTSVEPLTAKLFTKTQGKEAKFTLDATACAVSPHREEIIKSALSIATFINEYKKDISAALPDTPKRSLEKQNRDAAISRYKTQLEDSIGSLRRQFSELAVQDQFLVLQIIGRAYFLADQAQKRLDALGTHNAPEGKVDFDVKDKPRHEEKDEKVRKEEGKIEKTEDVTVLRSEEKKDEDKK